MQERGWSRKEVLAGLQKARRLDFSFEQGEILGSMCTAPHEIAAAAHARFLETNLGDPGHFPGTAGLEEEVLADLLELLHAPEGAAGRLVSGGTEANLLACHLARLKTGRTEVVVPESAHFSFEKAARLMGLRLVTVPSRADGHADAKGIAAAITDRTALVVAVAGTTELGLIDPIADIARACRHRDTLLHVDAAYGGYLLPFLREAGRKPIDFDFKLPGVWSLGIDPHKGGMATIPCGALLLRHGTDWDLGAVESPYLSTDTQSTLLGTRPGAAAASAWAVHRHLGRKGFASVAETCLDNAAWLAARLPEVGVELVASPELGVVTFHAKDPRALREALQGKGWSVNVVPRYKAIRIVANPHVTKAHLKRFLADLKACLA
ncbi:MAG TPA: tyrosine decarboxylase MfnA [Candidatus Thermoplasmatota archaeon]|nr:tyrosine decarboxylase MfnA [Candidatus Thermoplasmatota archaeon]